ncbi:MAG: PDZ domain-containing protein [Phycisphaerae bacterium]
MRRAVRSGWMVVLVAAVAARAAPPAPLDPAALHAQAARLLRVVRLTLESEDSKRAELALPGVVVAPDGLTMVSVDDEVLSYPRSYFKRVEFSEPGADQRRRAARWVGVHESLGLLFVEPVPKESHARHLNLGQAREPRFGEEALLVALLGESCGQRATFETARVGPNVGGAEFALAGLTGLHGGTGALVLGSDGAFLGLLTGTGEPSDDVGSDADARAPAASDFITQPLATRAATLAPAIAFAAKERRDWPEPWLGLAGLSVASDEIVASYGLPDQTVALVVGAVVPGYPAAAAGVHAKDFLIRLDDQPIERGATDDETLASLLDRVKSMRVGDEVSLTLWRDGGSRVVKLKLAEGPTPEHRARREFVAALGLAVRELVFDDRFYRRLDARQQGVVVAHLVQSGPAETAELQEGDIVDKLDDSPITNLDDFRRVTRARLDARAPAMVFSVVRGTSQRVVARLELTGPR